MDKLAKYRALRDLLNQTGGDAAIAIDPTGTYVHEVTETWTADETMQPRNHGSDDLPAVRYVYGVDGRGWFLRAEDIGSDGNVQRTYSIMTSIRDAATFATFASAYKVWRETSYTDTWAESVVTQFHFSEIEY